MAVTQIESFKERVLAGGVISVAEAEVLAAEGLRELWYLIAAAEQITRAFRGGVVTLCGIVNAKSGRCGENCAFCAQSGHYETGAPVFPLKSADEIVAAAQEAQESGATMFGIVTSGTRIASDAEWNVINEAVRRIALSGMKPCASLGMLDAARARQLKGAGLFRYHHNLETARSFFPNICTTHDYGEDVATVVTARSAGLSVCSGGIIGLGETMAQRIELADTLRSLDVDSVPLNILNPIAGTPLASVAPLTPIEILVTIAVFRFLLPRKDIKLCGGKERNLRQLLPLGLIAGASSLMTGNYLTTTGRDSVLDRELVADLGLTAKSGD